MRNYTIDQLPTTIDAEIEEARNAEMQGEEQKAIEMNERSIIKFGFDLLWGKFVDNLVRLKVEQLSFKRKQLISVQTALIYKLEDWERKEFMALQADLIKQIQEEEAHFLTLKGEDLYFRTWGNKRGAYEV